MPNDREPTDPGLVSPGAPPHLDRDPTDPARTRNPFDPAREPTDPSEVAGVPPRRAQERPDATERAPAAEAAPASGPSQRPPASASGRAPSTPAGGVLPPLPQTLIARLAESAPPDSPPTILDPRPTLGPLPLPSPPTSPARRIEEHDAELSEASGARLRDLGGDDDSVSGAVPRRRPHSPSRGGGARTPAPDEDAEVSEFSGAALRDVAEPEHSVPGGRLRRGKAGRQPAGAERDAPAGGGVGERRRDADPSRRLEAPDAGAEGRWREGELLSSGVEAPPRMDAPPASVARGRRLDAELSSAVAERLRVVVDHALLEESSRAGLPDAGADEAEPTARARTRVRNTAPRRDEGLRAATLPSGPPGLALRRSRRRRILARSLGAGVCLVVAVAGVLALSAAEPETLVASPLTRSFGTTADVDFRTPGGKTFRYTPRTSGAVISVLHYRADGLAPGALHLRLNGELLSEVEPAADDSAVRHRVRVLPAELLGRERPARIAFVPAGPTARWRIEDLWVEEVPAAPDAEAESRRQAARGRDALNRSVANPAALFEAWVAFRRAWIVLEPVQPRSPVYAELRAKYDAITESLDAQCAAMLLAAERSLRQRDVRGAQESLAAVQRYFPSGEHHCHNRALELTAEHGL